MFVLVSRLLLLLLIVSCEKKEVHPPELRPVKYAVVQNLGKGEERIFSGAAHAELETKLSFKVAGTIERLPVGSGEFVTGGVMIAQLDQLDYQLKEQETEAALLDAEAKLRNAGSDYMRIRELYETKSVSRQELDAARASAESAKANVKAAAKKVELAKAQLDYTTLLAPRDGWLYSVPVEERENVSVGQTIAILHSGNLIDVKVSMPENYIADIKKGDDVVVTFDAQPGKSFLASVSKVGVASSVSTTFPVTVKLKGEAVGIRPGMAAEVRFTFLRPKGERGVVIPSTAVLGEGAERFVFVLHKEENEEGTVEKRKVVIGLITNEGIQILQGLNEGELIVTAGIPFLHDGEKVRVIP